MSYHIYRTEAIVLRSYPHAEADRMLMLYTEDFGLIHARAQGVRHERSKLRYALTDFSRVHASLVRGKAGWRLVGAIPIAQAPSSRKELIVFARVCSLVLRLVHGEDRNEYLFHTLNAAHEQLFSGEDAELIEAVSVSRVLHALGYVAPDNSDGALFTEHAYESASLEQLRSALPRVVQRINDTLAVTQL